LVHRHGSAKGRRFAQKDGPALAALGRLVFGRWADLVAAAALGATPL
jgi:hypothetical protein